MRDFRYWNSLIYLLGGLGGGMAWHGMAWDGIAWHNIGRQ